MVVVALGVARTGARLLLLNRLVEAEKKSYHMMRKKLQNLEVLFRMDIVLVVVIIVLIGIG
jgi:hypothetical protein